MPVALTAYRTDPIKDFHVPQTRAGTPAGAGDASAR